MVVGNEELSVDRGGPASAKMTRICEASSMREGPPSVIVKRELTTNLNTKAFSDKVLSPGNSSRTKLLSTGLSPRRNFQ